MRVRRSHETTTTPLENTYRLSIEETKQPLMRLPEMQKLVGARSVKKTTQDDEGENKFDAIDSDDGLPGFLGWHTRAALREKGLTAQEIPVGSGFDPAGADAALSWRIAADPSCRREPCY